MEIRTRDIFLPFQLNFLHSHKHTYISIHSTTKHIINVNSIHEYSLKENDFEATYNQPARCPIYVENVNAYDYEF